MASKEYPKIQNPLILRYHRLLEAFSKSDDERDFYFDRVEGFLVYLNLDKTEDELNTAEAEIKNAPDRFCLLPKLTFYETKKFMEGFVNEKVYDIDTKEKLLDIIASREARENFLEFIYDHLTELDKWQQYYHERSRIRIIEWLRKYDIVFVFEEDLELAKPLVEKLKEHQFSAKVPKDVQQARDALVNKSKTYYSNEALNPRPKRGRPPKQQAKVELEPQLTDDIYQTIPTGLRLFVFSPDYSSNAVTFSSKFESEEQLLASLKGSSKAKVDTKLEALSQRLDSLRQLSSKLRGLDGAELKKEETISKIVSSGAGDEQQDDQDSLSQFFKGKFSEAKDKEKKGLKERLAEKKKKGVKSVTQIKYKKKKS